VTVSTSPPAPLVVVTHHAHARTHVTSGRPSRTERLWSAIADASPDRPRSWVGTTSPHVDVPVPGAATARVELDAAEVEAFTAGFCETTVQRLYHDAARPPAFHRHWWECYRQVNARCADAVADTAPCGATVWVHGHEFLLLPALLRRRRADVRIGCYLEIPHPPQELFLQLPWRSEILRGMLGADVIGFQHPTSTRNFATAVRRLTGATATRRHVLIDERTVVLGAYPMSVDFARLDIVARLPATMERVEQLRRQLGDPRVLLLGVDELDATAGIDLKLRAFAELLADRTLAVPDVVMVQLVRPLGSCDGRTSAQRSTIHRLVGQINGEHGRVGAPALHYLQREVPVDELLALYRAADALLVTPLRSGMDLVAKEYVASRVAHRGTLVLSEFSGSAHELRGAVPVNPHDLDGLKAAIVTAATMAPEEVQRRMRGMRSVVRSWDARRWASSFLIDLDARG
jgi:trehalose 6-phosphate synthase